jgi:hypothetical protein
MTSQASLSTLPARVRAAWHAQLAAAGQRPGLRATLLRQQAELLPRFAAAYRQLQALPRAQRHRLLRRLRQSLASLALLLALGQAPALAATIQVNGTTCTLVDAITAANNDAPVNGCTAANGGSFVPGGADIISLPANSTISLNSVNNNLFGPIGLLRISSAITIEGNGATITRASNAPNFGILGVPNAGNLTLDNLTMSGGTAFVGGGIASLGQLTLNNSTVSGNTASNQGGGIWQSIFSTMRLSHSLVSGNTAGSGAEVYNETYTYNSTYTYTGTVVSNDFNLFGHDGNAGTVNFTPAGSDIVPSQPLSAILGPLADNGGPTQTHALVPGSPAVDAAPAGPATDQRGVSRPQGTAFDIGAFELEEDSVSTADILAFFDQAVAEGTLTGVGSGKVAALRLKAVRSALVLAHELVERDRVRWACAELLLVLSLTDGQPQPRDLVTGEAASELARQSMNVRTALGCE